LAATVCEECGAVGEVSRAVCPACDARSDAERATSLPSFAPTASLRGVPIALVVALVVTGTTAALARSDVGRARAAEYVRAVDGPRPWALAVARSVGIPLAPLSANRFAGHSPASAWLLEVGGTDWRNGTVIFAHPRMARDEALAVLPNQLETLSRLMRQIAPDWPEGGRWAHAAWREGLDGRQLTTRHGGHNYRIMRGFRVMMLIVEPIR
jgi:hypothetical protein